MECLLKKEVPFKWMEECQQPLDTLKENMVSALILIFRDWSKEVDVNVDASSITLGDILAN